VVNVFCGGNPLVSHGRWCREKPTRLSRKNQPGCEASAPRLMTRLYIHPFAVAAGYYCSYIRVIIPQPTRFPHDARPPHCHGTVLSSQTHAFISQSWVLHYVHLSVGAVVSGAEHLLLSLVNATISELHSILFSGVVAINRWCCKFRKRYPEGG